MNQFLYALEQYSRTGHLFKQNHPTLPLSIWNYTPEVQYGQLWDEITIQCRGLVTDNKGDIVARPFSKFFNIEEGKHTTTSEFEVFNKMDGSLGILFNYKGEWILSTRGSFTSDQSIKGKEMLKKYPIEILDANNTYLFEILYKNNRIVVDYGDYEGLILLGSFNTRTGQEISYSELKLLKGFDIVQKYDGIKDYTKLKEMVENNSEGFVVRFSNGDRMKVKGQEYLRLHKIMTNISTTGIWEMLSNGGDINKLLVNVPDEFYDKIKNYANTLRYSHHQISEYCGKFHDGFRYGKYGDREVEPTKKEYAECVMKNSHPPYRSIMFAMWDSKPYDKLIWNILKPEFKKL